MASLTWLVDFLSDNDKYEKFKEQTDAQLKRQAEEEAMKEAERDSRESSKKKRDSRSE